MAHLTAEQGRVLSWAVESGFRSFAFEVMLGDPPHGRLTASGGDGRELACEPSDVRELEGLDLLRPDRNGKGYELTNLADEVYEQLKNPPAEPPPVGFRR